MLIKGGDTFMLGVLNGVIIFSFIQVEGRILIYQYTMFMSKLQSMKISKRRFCRVDKQKCTI